MPPAARRSLRLWLKTRPRIRPRWRRGDGDPDDAGLRLQLLRREVEDAWEWYRETPGILEADARFPSDARLLATLRRNRWNVLKAWFEARDDTHD